MKFVQRDMGEAAEASSGGGRRGWWNELLTLALFVALTLTVLYFGISFLTEQFLRRLPAEKEKAWFTQTAQRFESDDVPGELLPKWQLAQKTLAKLLLPGKSPALDYRLALQKEDEPNAYAMPGGVIAVTEGLLRELDEELSVAFVLAHELGHFAHRDHLRGLGKQVGFSVAVALVFGGDQLTQKVSSLIGLRYSRQQETEADLFGLDLVEEIYGKTEGVERLFLVLGRQEKLPGWAYMFSTHPGNRDRLRRLLEERRRQTEDTSETR